MRLPVLLVLLPACAGPSIPRDSKESGGSGLAYAVAGEYFETTSCPIGCPDMFGVDPPEEAIDALVAFRIVRGRVEGADLSGRTLAIAACADRRGRWTGALFVDEAADAPSREAAARLVAERFGSRFERLLPPRSVPMEWRREGSRHLLRIGPEAAIGHFEIDAVPGSEGRPITIANAPGALSPLVHLARSISNRLNDPVLGRSWQYQDRNASYGAFEWRSP
ncbi:MAG TPA: DUF1326 domain-containing protein [Planctomycetota bacterium]|jgi:hypothetical protein|nr:DUF1326 domain-containing protein [Planctomycetota bacterium]